MASEPANSARTSEVLAAFQEGRAPGTAEDFYAVLPTVTLLVTTRRLDPNDPNVSWAPTQEESEIRKNWARSRVLGETTPAELAQREQDRLNNARQLREAREEAEKAARLYVRENLYAGHARPERRRAEKLVSGAPRRLVVRGRSRPCGPRRVRRCSASTRGDPGGGEPPGESERLRQSLALLSPSANTSHLSAGIAAAGGDRFDSPKQRQRGPKPPAERRCEVCNSSDVGSEPLCAPCLEFAELRAEVERTRRDPFDPRRRLA